MGAYEFWTRGQGETARDAFGSARETALWEHGHGGYTGTIAEKHEFVLIPVPEGADPKKFAEGLMEDDDARVTDKWGPAGCVQVQPGEYLFFGYASS